jgi:dephospho-CoA kinase
LFPNFPFNPKNPVNPGSMVLSVGLTGGIGSGKTTVAHVFETLGIPVYYADTEAKRIMNEDAELKEAIIKNFGSASYKKGELDRAYLSQIVFNDSYKLDVLNSLVHPATIRDADLWMKNQNSPYVIKEAALLFESGAAGHLDYVIGVYAPSEMRIKRVMQRDGVSREEILKRIKSQMDENIKMKLCDFVITNDESELVVSQVLKIHEQLRH